MKQLCNNIVKASNARLSKSNNQGAPEIQFLPPKKLWCNNYSSATTSQEHTVNDTIGRIKSDLDHKLQMDPPNRGTNLTTDERNGLTWLQNNIKSNNIAIVKADKGGATIIINPELLKMKSL